MPSAQTGSAPVSSASAPAPAPSSDTCLVESPTFLSSGWASLDAHDNDYSFRYPSDWDRLYGAFVFDTASLVDPVTFAETGLPSSSETRADLVRAPAVGLPNASVLILPGVTSDTATVFARQAARFEATPTISVISDSETACLGGQLALGITFTFGHPAASASATASVGASSSAASPASPSAGSAITYEESWYVVRAGRLYDFQWLASAPPSADDSAIFREMFRTWTWAPNVPVATPLPSVASPSLGASASASAPPSALPGGSSFVIAGMALKIDTSAKSADPSTFVTSVPTAATVLYAVFSLKPGLSGQVVGTLKQGDTSFVTLKLDYGPTNSWGDFMITSTSGIAAGDYQMEITFIPTAETITLPFTAK